MTAGDRPRGGFITVEGVEGAGKTTQVGRLARWLEGLGHRITITSEPDGTPLGAHLRRLLAELPPLDPLAECLLFVAARAEHVRQVIRPTLEAGRTVVCDRFGDSTLAYQGSGRGVDLEVIVQLNRTATDGLVPDLTIVLDLDVAEGLRRARARRRVGAPGSTGPPPRPSPAPSVEPEDPFERLGAEFHERVRQGYHAIGEREPARVCLLDANQAEDAVADRVRAVVAARLGFGGV